MSNRPGYDFDEVMRFFNKGDIQSAFNMIWHEAEREGEQNERERIIKLLEDEADKQTRRWNESSELSRSFIENNVDLINALLAAIKGEQKPNDCKHQTTLRPAMTGCDGWTCISCGFKQPCTHEGEQK